MVRALSLLAIVTGLGMAASVCRAQIDGTDLKAAYIFNFAMFTTWPDANAKAPLVVCASPDNPLWPGLHAHPGDLWAEKTASSAFFPGRSPWPEMLSRRGIETVLIAGTATNVCCEASARDAATLGYRVIMLADANAGVNDAAHNATLTTIYRSYGDVRPVADVLRMIEIGERGTGGPAD